MMTRSRQYRLAERRVVAGVLLLVATLMVAACGGASAPGSERGAPGMSSPLPAGYALRLDRRNRDQADFVVSASGDGDLLVRTGPAGILYRPDQTVDAGGYTLQARFTEIDSAMGHREGFGLFIGGDRLGGDAQRYIYFLVRGDGRYLIKERNGPSTRELSNGWQLSEAVRVPSTAAGAVTNELSISVHDMGISFACNGAPLAELPLGALKTQGIVGVRVNHNLQVRIADLHVEP